MSVTTKTDKFTGYTYVIEDKDLILARCNSEVVAKKIAEALNNAEAERDALKAEMDMLLMLENYAQHDKRCPNQFARNCDCGFNQERQKLGDLRRAALSAKGEPK